MVSNATFYAIGALCAALGLFAIHKAEMQRLTRILTSTNVARLERGRTRLKAKVLSRSIRQIYRKKYNSVQDFYIPKSIEKQFRKQSLSAFLEQFKNAEVEFVDFYGNRFSSVGLGSGCQAVLEIVEGNSYKGLNGVLAKILNFLMLVVSFPLYFFKCKRFDLEALNVGEMTLQVSLAANSVVILQLAQNKLVNFTVSLCGSEVQLIKQASALSIISLFGGCMLVCVSCYYALQAYDKKMKQRSTKRGQLSEQEECIVCRSNGREVVFLPCKHIVSCETCWEQMQNGKCMLCQQEVAQVKQIRIE